MISLTERGQQVLEAVVLSHIQSGEPVGSRTISKHHGLQVSSATIRNVMADLEEMGLLQQPHTSAGRMPTEKGLRFYIDSLMKSKDLEDREKQLIQEALKDVHKDLAKLLQKTSRILSRFCKQAGVVLWPKLSLTRLKHIEFVRLHAHQIMVILITKSGLLNHVVLQWEEDIQQDELDKYGRYLNDIFEDVPLGTIKERILEEMKNEKILFDELYAKALKMTDQAFQSTFENSELYIEGQLNLIDHPEFSDVERLKRLFEAFEDKSKIIRLLDMALSNTSGVHIILGTEGPLEELNELSLISSPYKRGDTLLGALGVIGPLRMDYSRIVPVVEFTATLLSRLMEEPE